MRTALLAGSTGLIGKQLLELLLEDSDYTVVKAISRKPLDIQHAKLQNIVADFNTLTEHHNQLKANDVFCCLGTTIKQAGSQAAFRKVDYDYPLELAKLTKNQGASQYLIITALGSDAKSGIFYNRVKGEVEQAIDELGFQSYHILRPSLLLGERTEKRAGEGAATVVYQALGFLIPLKYKAIDSVKVARAMLHMAKLNSKGKFIHESKELQQF
ncbi:MAG: oxidoreductase [Cyclobacteriaceae bacterium]|nr:oxidoreductase [Cyclobacteriaceae bacterium]UYN87444.1 MAG: oxidoreductase [Cyclobacteriaceae bacterium]